MYSFSKITAFIFLTILFLSNFIFSQEIGRVRGVVTDSTNGEALAFGNVLIQELNIGASTDEHGYFLISSLPANKTYTLIVSYVGYQSKTLKVSVRPNRITELEIQLAPASIMLQTVEKIGKRVIEKNETDIGLQRISVKELESLPKGVETDVFRSLQYVPGVNFTADVSARYYVRGGDSNQNLILLNGANVYNPFHALGLFSVIDPEMINTMEFYKGGFTSEYGGRLSSVLNLITKDGNRKRLSGRATVSMLTAKALIEGPIPNGSYIITGRKSYNTEILKKFLNDQTAPFDFYDYSFKLNYSNPDFIPGSKFLIHGFFSNDKLENNDPLKEDFNWSNDIFGFSWFQVYDSPLFSELNISYSKFFGEVIPNFSEARAKQNDLTDLSLKLNFNYIQSSKDEIEAGIQINAIETNLYLENSLGVFSDISERGANISLFAKYKFIRWEELGVDVGARYNLTGLVNNSSGFFEPRVSVTYTPLAAIAFKAAWGIYQQEITTIANENEVITLFEPYILVPDYLETPKATHYNFGITFYLTQDFKIVSEIYYKDLRNITAINEDKRFETDPDLVSGSGESYGMEWLLQYTRNPISFTASYALAYAYKEVDNWLYYPRYDSRHAVNLALEVSLGWGVKASAIWTYKSGLPFTPIIGYYDKLYLSDFRGEWDIYNNYLPFATLGDKNISRLTAYHRLDLGVSKVFDFGFTKVDLSASVLNVYDRKNIFYYDRTTGEQVNMLPILPTVTIKVEI